MCAQVECLLCIQGSVSCAHKGVSFVPTGECVFCVQGSVFCVHRGVSVVCVQ